MSVPLLKVVGMNKSFPGVQALTDVSFEMTKGEIHALVGENGAGKSTLMKIICGIYKPDKGEIIIDGKSVKFSSTRESQEGGVSIIHQELNMPVNLSIAEFMFLGRTPTRLGMVQKKRALEEAQKLVEIVDINRDPATKIYELTVAEQQLVEIAKALSLNSKLLIMDEPTSALNQKETVNLFKIIRNLKEQGVTIIYISHKMNEIFEICDDIFVLRDGFLVGNHQIKDSSHELVVTMMTGKSMSEDYFSKGAAAERDSYQSEPVLKVTEISTNSKKLKTVSFDLFQGEVLGIAGLLGAGRTELFRAIFSADKKTQGAVFLDGKQLDINSITDAIKEGIVLLPEDRKLEGLVLQLDIETNITIPLLRELASFGLVNKKKGKNVAKDYSKQLRVKCTGIDQVAVTLSGGNQQKVIFAKWLASKPKVILLDDPTRGIDVGSKQEIYALIRDLANRGIGIVFVSSEMPELIGVCDRILVMRNGEIVSEAKGEAINENNLMMLATGF